MVWLEFFIAIILPAALWPWGQLSQLKISSRNISLRVNAAGACGWQPYLLQFANVMKSGSLNHLESSGPFQGLLYRLPRTSRVNVITVRDRGMEADRVRRWLTTPRRRVLTKHCHLNFHTSPTKCAVWILGFVSAILCSLCFISNRKTVVMCTSEYGVLFSCGETRPPAPTDSTKALCGYSLFLLAIAFTSPRSVLLSPQTFQSCWMWSASL